MGEFQVTGERRRVRAVVVANLASDAEEGEALAEIRELLRTAGADTVATLVQRRQAPHKRTFIGSGKLEELERLVEHVDPDVVVFDNDLSPSQQRALEEAVGRRVLDRTAVILDIFALHAHSAEGKLQVELAQLEYNLARMRGMWKHLERLEGALGSRGPGETQLETDRRLARRRIALLQRRLGEVSRQRVTRRKARQQSVVPKIALAGYTNAGKSTLLNTLTGSEVSARNRLFETLDPTTRSYDEQGRRYLITDTVGFIERLPHQLIDAFASTLEESLASDLIVVVADGSLSERHLSAQLDAVEDVLTEIGAARMPRLLTLNKFDLVGDRERLLRRYPDAIAISARTGEGLDELTRRIAEAFADRFTAVDLVVPYADAGIIGELYAAGAPVTRSDREDGIHAHAYLPTRMLGRVQAYRVDGDASTAVIDRVVTDMDGGSGGTDA